MTQTLSPVSEDYTKYEYLNEMLQHTHYVLFYKVKQKMRENLEILKRLLLSIEKEFKKDGFFETIYDKSFIGYDINHSRLTSPDEFTVTVDLKASAQWTVVRKHIPDYLSIKLNPNNLDYETCRIFFTKEGYLSSSNVGDWFQNLWDKAIHNITFESCLIEKELKTGLGVKVAVIPRDSCKFLVNFVPNFVFNGSQIPSGYRRLEGNFIIVPNNLSNNGETDIRWKVSFWEEQTELYDLKVRSSMKLVEHLVDVQGMSEITRHMINTCVF